MTWITNRVTEEYAAKGRALGVSDATLERIDRCARFIGLRTTLPNTAIYNQVWSYALHRIAQGSDPLPSDAGDFAARLTHWIYYGVIHPDIPYTLAQLRDVYAAFFAVDAAQH